MLVPVKIIVILDQEKVEIIIISSPTKLRVGGKARFVMLERIHHNAIRGKMVCIPRTRIIVRL